MSVLELLCVFGLWWIYHDAFSMLFSLPPEALVFVSILEGINTKSILFVGLEWTIIAATLGIRDLPCSVHHILFEHSPILELPRLYQYPIAVEVMIFKRAFIGLSFICWDSLAVDDLVVYELAVVYDASYRLKSSLTVSLSVDELSLVVITWRPDHFAIPFPHSSNKVAFIDPARLILDSLSTCEGFEEIRDRQTTLFLYGVSNIILVKLAICVLA